MIRWMKLKYWLWRGWFESKRPNGTRGLYGKLVYVMGEKNQLGIVVSDRCGRMFGNGTVIMRSDGGIQVGGCYCPVLQPEDKQDETW
jgi:hypothetical protein